MANFSQLKALQVEADDLSKMTVYGVILGGDHPMELTGRHGGESNKPYANAILKRSIQQQKIAKAGALTLEMAKSNRDKDKRLYSDHVITGWHNVFDADGKEVKFSPEECFSLFEQLPSDIFDEIRNHFGDPANFRDAVDADAAIAKGK